MSQLKTLREAAGHSQVYVATQLGIDQTAVSQWETDKTHPRTTLLSKLAALYNCTIDDLLTQP